MSTIPNLVDADATDPPLDSWEDHDDREISRDPLIDDTAITKGKTVKSVSSKTTSWQGISRSDTEWASTTQYVQPVKILSRKLVSTGSPKSEPIKSVEDKNVDDLASRQEKYIEVRARLFASPQRPDNNNTRKF